MQASSMNESQGPLSTRLKKYRLSRIWVVMVAARSVDIAYGYGEVQGIQSPLCLAGGALGACTLTEPLLAASQPCPAGASKRALRYNERQREKVFTPLLSITIRGVSRRARQRHRIARQGDVPVARLESRTPPLFSKP